MTTTHYEVLRVVLQVTTSYYEWYHKVIRGTTGGTTSHYELLRVVLQGNTRYYESLRGIKRGLRYWEWFFKGILGCELHQLAMTFLMDKVKVVFMISSDSDIIYFELLYR